MKELSKEDMLKAADLIRGLINGRVRVLLIADLLEKTLENVATLGDETEIAAAIKSLLVVKAGGFTTAQKAATEALMSRDLLPLGLTAAYQRALRDGQ